MAEDRSSWRPFIEEACRAVGVEAESVDEDAILDLTRVIAHDGVRPMAPVGAYILGIAVGRGAEMEPARQAILKTLEK